MRALLAHERRGLAATSAFLLGTIALTAAFVIEQRGLHQGIALVLAGTALVIWIQRLTRWRNLVSALLIVILFIPIGRYNLPGNLPFNLEPYRVAVAGLALMWVLSMLVDPRVRLRRSPLDAPLMLVLLTSLLSDLVNSGRVRPISTDVLKGQTFFISFFVVFYVVMSLVCTRRDLLFFVRLLAGGGGIVAACAVIERRTNYNVFDHLQTIFPVLRFEGDDTRFREGRLRVLASSQHPIALSVLFVVLLPLVIYLARGNRRWMAVACLYVVAVFTTASRTGIAGMLVLLLVYLFLQPRVVLRKWPLVIPLLAAVHIAAPGAIGTIRETINPSQVIAEQDSHVAGNDQYSGGRLTDVGPTLNQWSDKPLLGLGFGTRVISGPNANARVLDDQWLGTLLETGYLGFLAWTWLFVGSIWRLGRGALAEGDTDDGWLLAGFCAAIAAFAATMWLYDTFSFIQNLFICFILMALASVLLNLRSAEQIDSQPAETGAAATA